MGTSLCRLVWRRLGSCEIGLEGRCGSQCSHRPLQLPVLPHRHPFFHLPFAPVSAFLPQVETLEVLLAPMAKAGADPLGSMGNDAPLAPMRRACAADGAG